MKIAFLLISIGRSGGVRVTVEIANQLARLKHDCCLVVLGKASIPFPVHKDVKVIRVNSSRFDRYFGNPARIIAMAKAVPADLDIVVASYYLTAYVAVLTKLVARKAMLFYVIQGYEPNYFKQIGERTQWLSYVLARLSYYLPLYKTTISHWLSDVLAVHGQAGVPVVNNGIDTDVFSLGPVVPRSHELTIMAVANRRPRRGFYDFCDAIDLVANKRTNFRVLAIGSDPGVANALNVPYDSLTPSNDEELVAAYRSASIFVTCSHEEGFGLTPLEAMSCGVPVVCADSGGFADFARGGESFA